MYDNGICTSNWSNEPPSYFSSSSYQLTHTRLFDRGVHLRDLVLCHTALPDKLDDDLINFRKVAQMSHIFRDLMSLQNASSPVHGNMDLVNTIRVSHSVC